MTEQRLQQAGTAAEGRRRKRFRLKVNDFIEAQRETLREGRVSAVASTLFVGASTVYTWLRKAKPVFPDADVLTRFCEAADVSLDWLLTGDGSESKSASRAGATLTRDQLARELALHLVPFVCSGDPERYYMVLGINGREALKAVELAAVADRDATANATLEWAGDSLLAKEFRRALQELQAEKRAGFANAIEQFEKLVRDRRASAERAIESRNTQIVTDLYTWLGDVRRQARRDTSGARRIDSMIGAGKNTWHIEIQNPLRSASSKMSIQKFLALRDVKAQNEAKQTASGQPGKVR